MVISIVGWAMIEEVSFAHIYAWMEFLGGRRICYRSFTGYFATERWCIVWTARQTLGGHFTCRITKYQD